MTNFIKDNRGFTLIEILISTSIVATIFSIIFGVFFNVIEGKEKSERSGDVYQAVRTIFNVMENDIRAAVILNSSTQCCFLGQDSEEGGESMDSLTLTSLSSNTLFFREPETDQRFIKFKPEYDPENRYVIFYRTEVKFLDDEPDLTEAERVDLGIGLYGLNLRYLSEGRWNDTWYTKDANKQPDAVEIEIVMKDSSGEKRRFKDIIILELG